MKIICNEETLHKIDRHRGHINLDNARVLKSLEGSIHPADHLYHGRAIFTKVTDTGADQFSINAILSEGGYDDIPPQLVSSAPRNVSRVEVQLTKSQVESLNKYRGQLCSERNQVFVKVAARLVRGRYAGHLEFCDPEPEAELKSFILENVIGTDQEPTESDEQAGDIVPFVRSE